MTLIHAAWLEWPETQTLLRAFADAPLRFVGGGVRDALLGREVSDLDAATPLPPEQVMQTLKVAGIRAIPTGIDHGTITALVGKHHFELTTLRRDVATDGRRATVAYTEDWREDAARRDFTMNALYCDAHGEIFDYFGGAEDAKAGRVRFIGEARERILEDGLRILRFFRFFAHYGKGAIDREGLAACHDLAARIDLLSGERIQQEMFRLLVAERASEVVDLMQESGVWPHVVPGAVETHALKRLRASLRKAGHAPDAVLALAALLRSAGNAADLLSSIDKRWKLSKADYQRLLALCTGNPREWEERQVKKHIRREGKSLFIDYAILALAEGTDETHALAAIALARAWEIPIFPVTGNDLVARGIKPGKEMGILLARLEHHWEEQDYHPDKGALLHLLP